MRMQCFGYLWLCHFCQDLREKLVVQQAQLYMPSHTGTMYLFAETIQRLCAIFGRGTASNVSTVHRLVKKFEDTESTVNIKSPGRPRSG
ncbi:hypothetical protein C0J52_01226 [Blattella germanica]|nr:hypothetical protein C0J52_01226 [Blattella germanica]